MKFGLTPGLCCLLAILTLLMTADHSGAQSCAGDLNGDRAVTGTDLSAVLASWGPCPVEGACPADLNGDANVDATDLTIVLASWGPCPASARFVGAALRENYLGIAGAIVTSQLGGSVTTSADGAFDLEVPIPRGASSVTVSALATIYGVTYTDSLTVQDVYADHLYTLDPLILVPTNVECGSAHEWIPTFGAAPGISDPVLAVTVGKVGDDGALYAGGWFATAGGVAVNSVGKWDGESWSSLGGGVNIAVHALHIFDDGTGTALFAGGSFTTAGEVPVNRIAKWNGKAWSSLGGGLDRHVNALAVFDNGTGPALYAGGTFTTAGGVPANRVAKWDGATWSPLGSGVTANGVGLNGEVNALAVFDDGTGPALYAGGTFTTAGGVPAQDVARWDGTMWSPLGSGLSGEVNALAVFDDGTGPALYAGGTFTTAGGVPAQNVARWDGATWSPLGGGLNARVNALAVYDDETGSALYAGGTFTTAGSGAASRIARWNGNSWGPVSAGVDGEVFAIATGLVRRSAGLHVGGSFRAAGGVPHDRLATWDGSTWSGDFGAYAGGLNGSVLSLATFDDGSGPGLYAGGTFTQIDGATINRIARWDGTTWSSLGSGLNGQVNALTVYDDGTGPALYAGGAFTTAGGLSANRVARWDGQQWSPLGSGLNNPVLALAVYDDGDGPALYAGGSFGTAGGLPANRVAKWDGSGWSPLGVGVGVGVGVLSMTVFDDGTGPALYAGGIFLTAGGLPAQNVAKWDGQQWAPLGTGVGCCNDNSVGDRVQALGVYDDGTGPALYVGGRFNYAGSVLALNVARWDGLAWSDVGVGRGSVRALGVYDDGAGAELLVGQSRLTYFFAEVPQELIESWTGTAWASLDGGVRGGTSSFVGAMTVYNDGSGPALYIGGSFTGSPSGDSFLAKWGCVGR